MRSATASNKLFSWEIIAMSSKYKPSNRRQVYLALSAKIEGELRDLYAKRNLAGDETQASLAEKLNVNRSVINKRLTGHRNITLETLADMVWVLGGCIDVEIFDPKDRPSNAPRVVPDYHGIESATSDTGTLKVETANQIAWSAPSSNKILVLSP